MVRRQMRSARGSEETIRRTGTGARSPRAFAVVAACLCTLLVLLIVQRAYAAPPAQRSIGFSNLVFRIDGDDAIGVAKGDFRVHILEELRSQGLAAVGAESLVFGKDHGDAAQLLLGGTVRELDCRQIPGKGAACRLGIEWELLDVRSDAVVYRVLTRSAVYGIDLDKPAGVPTRLVLAALRSMTKRKGFRLRLRSTENAKPSAAESYANADYKACGQVNPAMPIGTEAALNATVVVKTDAGFGSGFFLNAEGYVITAAHVVADAREITVKTRAGTIQPAELIRISQRLDVALLRVKGESGVCFAVEQTLLPPGTDVYAIGSPASEELAFSVTRGIVSGERSFDGVPFLQTDASISPGNSGGPLVNQAGKVAAIVSWKLVGDRFAGLAFGVPAFRALQALGLSAGGTTSEGLTHALSRPKKESAEAFTDSTDAMPSLDAELDARRERERAARREKEDAAWREREADAKANERQARVAALTPGYVKIMKWGGIGLAAAGAVTAVVSYGSFDKNTTAQDKFDKLRLANDIGWVAVALGAASAGLSFALTPTLPPEKAAAKRTFAVELGPTQLRIRLCY